MKGNTFSKMMVLVVGLIFLSGLVSFCFDAGYPAPASNRQSVRETFSLSYTPHEPIWIIGNEELHTQAAAESWPGDGSAEAPYLITGYYFDQYTQPLRMWDIDLYWKFIGNEIDGNSSVQCGFWIVNCTNGAIVENDVHHRHSGMYLEDLANFNVSYNHVHDNRWHGIEILGYCNDSYISNNMIHSNVGSGIRITQPKNTMIETNTILGCGGSGIQFMGVSFETEIAGNNITFLDGPGIQMGTSFDLVIKQNDIYNVTDVGIYLINANGPSIHDNTISIVDGNGISLGSCDFAQVTDNEVSGCTENGIRDASSENSTILRNRFEANTLYGAILGDTCKNATVSWNAFVSNGNNPQVCDDGMSNSICYNYYSEWTSPDVNSDLIVDSPYLLDGVASSQDLYPLAEPNATPVTSTSTNGSQATFPTEIILIGVGGIVVVLIAALLIKRRV